MSQIRIGISGWTFPPWRGHFYPKKWVQKRELEYASREMNSLEINGTFYSLQKPKTFQNWYEQTPENFLFSVKAPQFITHVLRLKECKEPLNTFLASGLLCLKNKLGPILWQFPPYVTLKDDRFETFAKLLPQNSQEAAEYSKNHSSKILGCAWTEAGGNYPIRHAFELRHPSFQNSNFIEMLKAYRIAVVFPDSSKKSPYFEDLTSNFIYLRMQGEDPAYEKGYSDSVLKRIAARVRTWASGKSPPDAKCFSHLLPFPGPKDIFIYFNNDVKLNSPQDAIRMMKILKIPPG